MGRQQCRAHLGIQHEVFALDQPIQNTCTEFAANQEGRYELAHRPCGACTIPARPMLRCWASTEKLAPAQKHTSHVIDVGLQSIASHLVVNF